MTHFEIDDVSVECSIDCVNLADIMAGKKILSEVGRWLKSSSTDQTAMRSG